MGKLVRFAKIGLTSLVALTVVALLGLSLPVSGRRALSVQTGSMEPAIKTGSLVFMKRVPAASIAAGDVITYINPLNKAQTITHRVERVAETRTGARQFVTKGDANPAPDQPIAENLILGRVDTVVPYVGHARDFIYTWPGLVTLVYTPALIVAIGEIRRLAAHYRIQHYELPEMLLRKRTVSSVGRHVVALIVAGLFALTVAVPVHAALQSSATLTGNTISVKGSEAPQPPPEPTPDQPTDLGIRRVFIVCGEGETTATHVQIVLYNASRMSADISGWTIKSGNQTLLTIPQNTQISGPGLYETEAPIIEGISYSSWHLTLRNQDDEQIHEHSWDINTTRACRLRG